MKNVVLIILALGLVSGCGRKPGESEPATAAESKSGFVTMDLATQQRIGLKTETLQATQFKPEIRCYGRVVDPATLAAETGDMEIAKVANDASQAELNRLKTLAAQDNASQRTLQSAEVAAARDAAAFDAARLKVLASWGPSISQRSDLTQIVESLSKFESALVRIDIQAGEPAKNVSAARIVTLDGSGIEGAFAGEVPSVDPQRQSRSILFLVQSNSANLRPGAAVTAFLQSPGEPINGVVVPRSAVIRHEGSAWVYTQSNGTNFTRRLISVDVPTGTGWFVTNAITSGDNVVVTGAQTVFSQELSANGFNSGERE